MISKFVATNRIFLNFCEYQFKGKKTRNPIFNEYQRCVGLLVEGKLTYKSKEYQEALQNWIFELEITERKMAKKLNKINELSNG